MHILNTSLCSFFFHLLPETQRHSDLRTFLFLENTAFSAADCASLSIWSRLWRRSISSVCSSLTPLFLWDSFSLRRNAPMNSSNAILADFGHSAFGSWITALYSWETLSHAEVIDPCLAWNGLKRSTIRRNASFFSEFQQCLFFRGFFGLAETDAEGDIGADMSEEDEDVEVGVSSIVSWQKETRSHSILP